MILVLHGRETGKLCFLLYLCDSAPMETPCSQHICHRTQNAKLAAFWMGKFHSSQRRPRGQAWKETKGNMRKNVVMVENGAFWV